MKRIIIAWFISISFLSPLIAQAKKPLSPVIASTRRSGGYTSYGAIVDRIYGGKNESLTHRETFGGKAWTIDIEPVFPSRFKYAKRHTIADATTYDFSKFEIREAFIERFPTVRSKDLSVKVSAENYLGKCIENLSTGMDSGARLDIEWHPFTTLMHQEVNVVRELIQQDNPFHGFINADVMLQAVDLLEKGEEKIHLIPEDMLAPIQETKERMADLLRSYEEQGIGTYEDMLSLIYQEANIVRSLIAKKKNILINYETRAQDHQALSRAFQLFLNMKKPLGPLTVNFQGKIGVRTGIYYDLSTFLEATFFNFIMEEIAVIQNSPLVMTYLDSIGFDSSISKRQSPYTNRNNVWFIEAVKR